MKYFLISFTFGLTDLLHSFPALHLKVCGYFWSVFLSVKFQLHKKLCSKYSSLVFLTKLYPNLLVKGALYPWMRLGYLGFNFTYTSWIICYPTTPIVEIIHIFYCLWSIAFCTGNGYIEIFITSVSCTLIFISHYNPVSINLWSVSGRYHRFFLSQ